MTIESDDPVAAVQAWRVGHDDADPIALAVVEALARRAATRQGAAREQIVERVRARLLQMALPPAAPDAPIADATVQGRALSGLSALVDLLGRDGREIPTDDAISAAPPDALLTSGLRSVAAHRGTWSRLRAEQRLHQAAAQVPAHAGPLHSAQVIYRALRELHALSPAYLDAFLTHVEALMALEQAAGGPLPKEAAAAPAPAGRRAGRPRKASGAA